VERPRTVERRLPKLAAREIRRVAPSIKIIFHTIHDVPSTASEVSADAFVSKSASAQELIATIERVAGQSDGNRTRAKSA
jgi:DNA-binding NarL/FixJ family response regulator